MLAPLSRALFAAALVLFLATDSFAQSRGAIRPPAVRGRPVAVRSRADDRPKFDGNPPRHVGNFPAFNLIWEADGRLRDVLAVYPHPMMPRRVVLVTASGLLVSDDTGQTWKELPGTAPAAVGAIRHLAFAPDVPDAIYLSSEKGLWRIADAAKPPVLIGSKGNGLLSDSVFSAAFDGADPTCQTILAAHGSDAPGLSRSVDGGRSWSGVPLVGEYHVYKILCGGPGLSWAFLIAAPRDPDAPRGVYFCHSIGDYLKDYLRDVQPVEGAAEILFNRPFAESNDISYWATSAAGLLRTEHNGTNSEHLGPEDVTRWASVGLTYGATADARLIYGYEPEQLGLAVSSDDGKTFASFSRGLPTGRFVKQGAQVRANAGGSVFFAAINNSLYVGRRYTGSFAISDLDVNPPVIRFSHGAYGPALASFRSQLNAFRDQRRTPTTARAVMEQYEQLKSTVSETVFALTARVTPGEDLAADERPISVSVDLSRVGGSARTVLHDDGLHGDGAAGDGVWGITAIVRPDRMQNHYQDLRRHWPGPMPLTVTVVAADGSLSSAVAVMGMLNRPEAHVFWTPSEREVWKDLEGGLQTKVDDYQTPGDKKALELMATDKPWSLALGNNYDRNLIGYAAVSFYIKADGPPPKELYLNLMDGSPDTASASTPRVPLLAEKCIEGGVVDGRYRRVVVPFARLLRDPVAAGGTPFRPAMLKSVVLSGDGGTPRNYWLSEIRFHASLAELKVPAGGARP